MSIKHVLSFLMRENRIGDSEKYGRNPELFIPGTNDDLFRNL